MNDIEQNCYANEQEDENTAIFVAVKKIFMEFMGKKFLFVMIV